MIEEDFPLNIDDDLLYDGICADCRQLITTDNDSGWYAFVASGAQQKLCIDCNDARMDIGLKWNEVN
jgi:hypothetical protein